MRPMFLNMCEDCICGGYDPKPSKLNSLVRNNFLNTWSLTYHGRRFAKRAGSAQRLLVDMADQNDLYNSESMRE